MPPVRDAILQPRIDPPRRIEPDEVRRRWPGAVEALCQHDRVGRLTVGSEGTLWFKSDGPGAAFVWGHSLLHGMTWLPQAEFRGDRCPCGRPLKEHGRCARCGLWPSRCMCPKEAA